MSIDDWFRATDEAELQRAVQQLAETDHLETLREALRDAYLRDELLEDAVLTTALDEAARHPKLSAVDRLGCLDGTRRSS